jgi:hypothetical protein
VLLVSSRIRRDHDPFGYDWRYLEHEFEIRELRACKEIDVRVQEWRAKRPGLNSKPAIGRMSVFCGWNVSERSSLSSLQARRCENEVRLSIPSSHFRFWSSGPQRDVRRRIQSEGGIAIHRRCVRSTYKTRRAAGFSNL